MTGSPDEKFVFATGHLVTPGVGQVARLLGRIAGRIVGHDQDCGAAERRVRMGPDDQVGLVVRVALPHDVHQSTFVERGRGAIAHAVPLVDGVAHVHVEANATGGFQVDARIPIGEFDVQRVTVDSIVLLPAHRLDVIPGVEEAGSKLEHVAKRIDHVQGHVVIGHHANCVAVRAIVVEAILADFQRTGVNQRVGIVAVVVDTEAVVVRVVVACVAFSVAVQVFLVRVGDVDAIVDVV